VTFPLRRSATETAELRAIIDVQSQRIAELEQRLAAVERRTVAPAMSGLHANLAGVASWVRPRVCASGSSVRVGSPA
jgi:hypothetical protein